MANKKTKKNEESGSAEGSDAEGLQPLYTLKDVRDLYGHMLEEHYSTTLKWLKWVYPFIIAAQFMLVLFVVLYAGWELSFETLSPLSEFGFCMLVSVTWPMFLAPVNRSRAPTMTESELILCARYIQANCHIDQEELAARLFAHSRIIQCQMVNEQQLKKTHFFTWLYLRVF